MRNTIALALLLVAPAAHATTYYSDTADLARYVPRAVQDAKLIESSKSAPEFTTGGAKYQAGLHLTAAPETSDKGTLYHAAALMSDATGRLFYRKFQMIVAGTARKLSVAIEKDIDLKDMHFSVNTGLEDRMVVVEDAANDITLAFPLGVGGLDEAVMSSGYRILTPKFHDASLERKTVIKARSEPAYYRDRPFMPITTAKGTTTAIAFHITILDDSVAQQNGLNYLVRGFESHGCMRLREKDLMEFFTIVENGADDKLPVNVDSHVWNRNAEGARDAAAGPADIQVAYPANNSSYMRVTYFTAAPHYQRDDIPGEHLVIMDRATGQPDFRRLDLLQDSMDLFTPGGLDEADLIDNRYPMP